MKPSVGKKGVDGCFLVEVKKGQFAPIRVLARRFKTEAEAIDFHTRSSTVHQQKANRERVMYAIAVYETATPRDPKPKRVIAVEAIYPSH